MAKRMAWAVLAVFIWWSIADFLIHGLLLKSEYAATPSLWRPLDQMNMTLVYLVTLVVSLSFVLIYGLLVGKKSIESGVTFGALFGLASGISMGFGSYSSMPITLTIAWSWFIGSWVQAVVAGAIAGAIVKS